MKKKVWQRKKDIYTINKGYELYLLLETFDETLYAGIMKIMITFGPEKTLFFL